MKTSRSLLTLRLSALTAAVVLGTFTLAPPLSAAPADDVAAQKAKALQAQISASQGRIKKLESDLRSADDRIEKRISKAVDSLCVVGDSKDSGTKVARMKEDVIDFLRKQISDYSRRRAQLRASLDSPIAVIPAETVQSDMAKIDARIDKRIAQVVALGGSFASHQDHDKYDVSGSDWYGGTDYRINEDYAQNKKATNKAGQAKRKLTSAIDDNIKRLEFANRTLQGRTAGQSAKYAARIQADITRNEALIESLQGWRSTLLMPAEGKIRALGSKEAQAIYERLKDAGVEARRDQNTLTGIYNNLNSERAKLAPLMAAEKKVVAAP